ncbi:MAG: SusC/RagA family TonB-linked outer membrane protein [Bacteroidia bacterium]|nr:SusC/RagA family TonB-linked outer membrane protein [Bacteroidia bacterium]
MKKAVLQGKNFWQKGLTMALIVLFAMVGSDLSAQTTKLSGRVTDGNNNEGLVGALVSAKGTKAGAITGSDGSYNLEAPSGADSLVFSYYGYATQTVAIGNRTTIDITLEEAVTALNDVVITALGVARDEKALGYAIQTVNGDQLTQARETNLLNALAGKVAGVQVTGTPSGVGSSARITIRGDKSLNINGNSPLFVVDGVPILNDIVGSSGRGRQDADYGNLAAVVNPDDIAAISVLKGANASALYGSRGANGVILITTKSGAGSKGIGVSINSTLTFENPLVIPEYQNVYGQGVENFAYVDGANGGVRDGTDESWGPAFDPNLLIPQYDSPRRYLSDGSDSGFRGADLYSVDANGNLVRDVTEIVPTPWIARPDNVRDFFETGVTLTNNVAISGGNDQSNFRLSLTNLNQKGMVPNTDLGRNTIAFSGGIKPTDKLSVRTVINYVKTNSDNRPNNSYGTENIMYLFNCWLGRQVDLETSKEYWQRGQDGLQQFGSNYNYHDNPYFNLYENTNGQNADRLFGNIVVKYDFTDWLNIQLRSATDYNSELRTRRRAFSTQRFPFGSYGEERILLEERNSDFLLNFDKTFGKLGVNISAGANRMDRRYDFLETFAGQLLIPNIYNFGNSRVELQNSLFKSQKRINSVYGFAQLSYQNSIFLDLTARNDWSSTLPLDNNSYFYPSASLSVVLSDLMTVPEWVSFAKFRTGLALVGNDTDPYQLTQVYNAGTPFGSDRVYSESSGLVNPELKPEISTSFEIGADLRFFKGRVGLDLTYYNIQSRNQIIGIPLTNTTGYSQKLINAGEVRNYGYEAMLNVVPVKMNNGFTWDVNFNFSANRSEVVELTDEINNYVMASRYVTVEARVGERMGSMYAIGYKRVDDPNSEYDGEIILNSQGRPVGTTERVLLGNYNPDWMMGIYNTFSFKGVRLGALLDIRQGGEVYSHTQTVGREGGQIIETLEGRANGYDLSVEGNGVYFPGVYASTGSNGETVYLPNDPAVNPSARELTAREFHTAITQGRRILENMIYDASYVKLREVQLSYSLPNSLMASTPFRNVSITAVGRNLFVWSQVPHVDPETASVSGGTLIPGVESVAIPSARSYGVNLSLNF